jgi:hypothetical protein
VLHIFYKSNQTYGTNTNDESYLGTEGVYNTHDTCIQHCCCRDGKRRLYPHCNGMLGMEMEPWKQAVATFWVLTSPKLGTQPVPCVMHSCMGMAGRSWPCDALRLATCKAGNECSSELGWLAAAAWPCPAQALPACHACSQLLLGRYKGATPLRGTVHTTQPSPLWACGSARLSGRPEEKRATPLAGSCSTKIREWVRERGVLECSYLFVCGTNEYCTTV